MTRRSAKLFGDPKGKFIATHDQNQGLLNHG